MAYQEALKVIPPFRAGKARQFAFGKDRRLSVGAWLLLESALQAYGTPLGEVKLTYNECGKPSLEEGPHFNLSHSGSVVMCSVSTDCAVGCDVEKTQAFDEQLAHYCMQPHEVDAMLALPKHDRSAAFYRRWTLKESYMKARGKGLNIHPVSFAVDYGKNGEPRISQDNSCSLAEFPEMGGYRFSACALSATAHFKPIVQVDLTRN